MSHWWSLTVYKSKYLAFILLMVIGNAIASEQVITPNQTEITVSAGQSFDIEVNYSTANPVDETLTGIGLRLHFDSSEINFDSVDNLTQTSIFVEPVIEDDIDDIDNDPNTDKLLKVAWVDFAGRWPGEGETPLLLYTASFLVNDSFSGSSQLNFTADTAAGRSLSASPVLLTQYQDQPPVFEQIIDVSQEAQGIWTDVSLPVPLVSDAEDGTITPTTQTSGPFGVGVTTADWIAVDSFGHQVTGQQTITITDTTPPDITPPATQTVEATARSTAVTLNSASATDLVDGAVDVTPDLTGPYTVASHTITWQAQDSRGNRATQTSLLVVQDTTAPNLIAPADVNLESETGESVEYNLGQLFATDLVDESIQATPSITGPFPPGQTVVTWRATDTAGNTATATQIITVTTKDQLPTIATNADITTEATGQTTVVELTPPQASDAEDGALTPQADKQGPFAVGEHTITWTVTDSANQSAFSLQNVIITDTTPPAITPPATQTVEATAQSTAVTLNSATATDLVDGAVDVTPDLTGPFSVASHTITWQAQDSRGNGATQTSLLVVQDTTPPEFKTLPNDISVLSIDGNAVDVVFEPLFAEDLVDGQISAKTNAVGPFALGEHEIIWTAQDGAGNIATVAQKLKVIEDDIAPTIEAPADIIVEATGPLTSVELGTPNVSDDHDMSVEISVSDIGPFVVGEHSIIWTAIDDSGNESNAAQVVTITDKTNPVFDELPRITIDAKGSKTQVNEQKLVPVTAIDLVDGVIAANLVENYLLPSGRHQVIWQATDQALNSASAIQEVDILPMVNLGIDQIASVGSQVDIIVTLTGEAPSYPVDVELDLVGNIVDGINIPSKLAVQITQGIEGSAHFVISQDTQFVEGDVIAVELGEISGATTGYISSSQIVMSVGNKPPMVNLVARQNGVSGFMFAREEGVVSVSAEIFDINSSDTHTLNWTSNDSAITDLAIDNDITTFEFDAQTVTNNQLNLSITAIEQTPEQLSTSRAISLSFADTAPVLTEEDSDGDGISDIEEGYNDTDGDGIADFLDNDPVTNRLPMAEGEEAIETQPGLILQIGQTATSAMGYSAQGAGLTMEQLAGFGNNGQPVDVADPEHEPLGSIVDFVISGLGQSGAAAKLIIPLPNDTILPEHATYRKFSASNGWQTFIEGDGNFIASTKRSNEGVCPPAGDPSYTPSLTQGDQCIELTIVDGGIYDQDGLANGQIIDPGLISAENLRPIALISSSDDYYETELINIDGSNSYDPEGLQLSYVWQQVNGPDAELVDFSSESLSFVAPMVEVDSELTFILIVNDGVHDSLATETIVHVKHNQPPVAHISSNKTVVEAGETVNMYATDSHDPEGVTLSYSWRQTAGSAVSLTSQDAETIGFTAPELTSDEDLTFELIVNDGLRDSPPVSLAITVKKKEVNNSSSNSDSSSKSSSGGSMGIMLTIIFIGLIRKRVKISV